jgi:hypothetical protein
MAGYAPLNGTLYGALRRVFGEVGVEHPGVAMRDRGYRNERKPGGGTYKQLDVVDPGENYYVPCPFCKSAPDKKLYINHTWGVWDGTTSRLTLAHCFRPYACMSHHANREALLNYLSLSTEQLKRVSMRRGRIREPEESEPRWPEAESVSDLPPGHPAALYLANRGFDLDFLAESFRVHYCFAGFEFQSRNRIIIPFFRDGEFIGWQGRCPADLPWKDPDKRRREGLPPKYTNMPGFRKSLCLYDFDRAREAPTIVVCEGVTGVWRHAEGVEVPYATAVQGMSPSPQQLRLLAKASKKRKTIVWLLDPGAAEFAKAEKAMKTLRAAGYPSFVASLPEGHDSGDLDAEFQRSLIETQAAEAGCPVEFVREGVASETVAV